MQFRQKTHRDKDGNIRQGQTVQLMRYTYDAENKRGRPAYKVLYDPSAMTSAS